MTLPTLLRPLRPALALLITATLIGCAQQAKVTGSWQQGASRDQSFNRVLVVGVSPNASGRCDFESFMTNQIRAVGADAKSSCMYMKTTEPLTVEAIEAAGLDSIADSVMERWFGEEFRASGNVAKWHRMLIETSVEGYVGCCRAIAGADLANTTCELRLPVLGIAGSSDLSTPPDLVANTIVMIPRARLEVVAGAGHLPCVEQPEKFARFVLEFLETTKYV